MAAGPWFWPRRNVKGQAGKWEAARVVYDPDTIEQPVPVPTHLPRKPPDMSELTLTLTNSMHRLLPRAATMIARRSSVLLAIAAAAPAVALILSDTRKEEPYVPNEGGRDHLLVIQTSEAERLAFAASHSMPLCARDRLKSSLIPSTGTPLVCSGLPMSPPRHPSSTFPVRRYIVLLGEGHTVPEG